MTPPISETFEEKTCTACGESWPADEQFFRRRIVRGIPALYCHCRACEHDQAVERHARKSLKERPQCR